MADEITERIISERLRGHSVEEIAAAYGWKPSAIQKVIKRSIKCAAIDSAKSILRMELVRLDMMQVTSYERAIDRMQPPSPEAIDSVLKIMKHRSDLLGLKAANKIALTDTNGNSMQQVLFYLPENGRDLKEPSD